MRPDSVRAGARTAGALYLIVILCGMFAELFVRGPLLAADPVATANNILAHERLFRLGVAAELFALMCNLPLSLILYRLLGPASPNAALLLLLFSMIGTAVEATSLLAHVTPLVILKGGEYAALTLAQRQEIAHLSLDLFENGFTLCLVFFSGYCVSAGFAITRATFFPRWIGVLMMLGGLCYFTLGFTHFLVPDVSRHLVPYILLPPGLGEMSLCLALLIYGVNAERWRTQMEAGTRP